MRTKRKPDHGSFRFQQSLEEERTVIKQLEDQARGNRVRPGHGWCRLALEANGRPVAFKEFHVDLDENLVEVWETWNGVETARKTLELSPAPN